MKTVPDESKRIQALETGFKILKQISLNPGAVTLSELTRQTGLHKSQLYRYLNSLVHLGVLVKKNSGDMTCWSLGPELIMLGNRASESFDVVREAVPFLIKLRNELNENIALSIWKGDAPYFIKSERCKQPIHVHIGLDGQVPLYTNTGKIFRAYLEESVTQELYEKELEKGIIEKEEYDQHIQVIRSVGYASGATKHLPSIITMSAPVFNVHSQLAAALSIMGLAGMFDEHKQTVALRMLLEAAEEVSYRMGYSGPFPVIWKSDQSGATRQG
jgi:DNA-binding IclR family transcriptional regulator